MLRASLNMPQVAGVKGSLGADICLGQTCLESVLGMEHTEFLRTTAFYSINGDGSVVCCSPIVSEQRLFTMPVY